MWIFCSSQYKLNYLWFDFISLEFILRQQWNYSVMCPFFPLLAIQIFQYKLWHTCVTHWFFLLALSCLVMFQTLDLFAMRQQREITPSMELCILHVTCKITVKGKVLVQCVLQKELLKKIVVKPSSKQTWFPTLILQEVTKIGKGKVFHSWGKNPEDSTKGEWLGNTERCFQKFLN